MTNEQIAICLIFGIIGTIAGYNLRGIYDRKQKKKKEVEEEKKIEYGEHFHKGDYWYMIPKNGDPFPDEKRMITIWEYKQGWVRYAHGDSLSSNALFNDERMDIEKFLQIYYRPSCAISRYGRNE